jgi:hypothetical protein
MFNIQKYSKDYYLEGKYIGSLPSEKDREVFGYQGRLESVLESDIILKKKVIKKGTKVVTELIPICGRMTNQ